jgi:hypothetical protein
MQRAKLVTNTFMIMKIKRTDADSFQRIIR